MYILDTCTCIDFLRGRLPNIQQMVAATDPLLFGIPAIVEAELRIGVEKSSNPTKERQRVDLFLSAFQILPFDSSCAKAYAGTRAELEAAGTPIGPLDTLIAATALAHHATLVTSNAKEFTRVSHLHVETWEEIAWN